LSTHRSADMARLTLAFGSAPRSARSRRTPSCRLRRASPRVHRTCAPDRCLPEPRVLAVVHGDESDAIADRVLDEAHAFVLAAGTVELAALLLTGRPHVAALEMVVHDPERLHRRVHRRGSDEPEPAATQLLGERRRLRRRRGKVAEAYGHRAATSFRLERPHQFRERPGLCLDFERRAGVGDRRLDLPRLRMMAASVSSRSMSRSA
jgi:hypothetical protein